LDGRAPTLHAPATEPPLDATGVTRGRSLVVLVGQKKAVAIAVRGVRNQLRWSKLREWLTAGSPPS